MSCHRLFFVVVFGILTRWKCVSTFVWTGLEMYQQENDVWEVHFYVDCYLEWHLLGRRHDDVLVIMELMYLKSEFYFWCLFVKMTKEEFVFNESCEKYLCRLIWVKYLNLFFDPKIRFLIFLKAFLTTIIFLDYFYGSFVSKFILIFF